MAWTTPIPAAVSAFRDMIVACASSVSFGLVQANIHYPKAVVTGTGAESRPFAVLTEVSHNRSRYAEAGVLGNPSGTLTATIHAESTVSTLEELARNICSELTQQSTGLPLRSAVCTLSSDPTPGQRAADLTTADNTAEIREVTITVEWGLNP